MDGIGKATKNREFDEEIFSVFLTEHKKQIKCKIAVKIH